MKRKLSLMLALILLLSALCGCGGSKKTLEPAAFVQEMLQGASFTDSLNELDDAVALVLYGVDSADVTDVVCYAGTAATAEEIAVFTAKDATAADRVLQCAQARVAAQIESYKNYGPASAMMLENAIVKKSGNFVVVVVCSDADGAAKIADNYI